MTPTPLTGILSFTNSGERGPRQANTCVPISDVLRKCDSTSQGPPGPCPVDWSRTFSSWAAALTGQPSPPPLRLKKTPTCPVALLTSLQRAGRLAAPSEALRRPSAPSPAAARPGFVSDQAAPPDQRPPGRAAGPCKAKEGRVRMSRGACRLLPCPALPTRGREEPREGMFPGSSCRDFPGPRSGLGSWRRGGGAASLGERRRGGLSVSSRQAADGRDEPRREPRRADASRPAKSLRPLKSRWRLCASGSIWPGEERLPPSTQREREIHRQCCSCSFCPALLLLLGPGEDGDGGCLNLFKSLNPCMCLPHRPGMRVPAHLLLSWGGEEEAAGGWDAAVLLGVLLSSV